MTTQKYAALMAACREMDVEHGSLGEDMGCVPCQHFMKALRDLGEDFDTVATAQEEMEKHMEVAQIAEVGPFEPTVSSPANTDDTQEADRE